MAQVDISGINKADLLCALYNNSRPQGMGIFQATEGDLTREEAISYIYGLQRADNDFGLSRQDVGKIYGFDYLRGRPLKCNIEGDTFEAFGYDQDNGGEGTAARIVAQLRGLTNTN